MIFRLAAGCLVFVLGVLLFGGCIFGGGDDVPSVERPSSIPTATPPATLPEPLLLGQTQGNVPTGGTTGGTTTGTYTVKSGDTLYAIAASLNVPSEQQAAWVAEVLRLNGLPDASLLAAGQELRLPALPTPQAQPTSAAAAPTATRPASTATAAPAATSASTPAASPVAGGAGTYTVVAGDNPSVIAEKLGVPASQQAAWAAELASLNGINPNNLQIGQVLRLPANTPSGGGGAAPTATPRP